MRRFYRLAPALAVVLAISAILMFLLGPINDHQRFARQGIATLLLIGNIGANRYSGDYFSSNPNPLVHTWSLSVEEQIYIFLPLIMILILHNRSNVKKITAVALGVISVLSFLSFLFPTFLQPLYSLADIEIAAQISFYSPIDRIWQFTIGGIAFLSADQYHNHARNIPKSIRLLIAISVVIILFGPLRINLKVSSIFVSLFAVTIIITKSLYLLPSFLNKIFEWVGDRSYSIYLFHMPLLYLAKYSPVTKIGNGENQIIYITIAIAASIMLGSLSFSMIENRFRNRDKSNLINLKNLIVSLALTLVFPLILFLLMDRTAVTHRVDVNLPVPSQPYPWKWDSNCQVMGEDSKIERPCVYGNLESNKSILLIGDSHAASNSRAIIEVAQHNSLKAIVFTQSSCPFILNKAELSDSYELPGLSTNCIIHNQEILDYINIYKPTITILSMRSTSAYIFPNTKLSRALYRKNILNSLSDLRESQTQIILLGPEPEYVPIATWLGKIFGQKGYYSDIPKEDGEWWSKVSMENFQYMSTLDIFCSQNKCKNNSGSIWLFNDEHHLSQQGAKMLIPELNLIVRKILNRSF